VPTVSRENVSAVFGLSPISSDGCTAHVAWLIFHEVLLYRTSWRMA